MDSDQRRYRADKRSDRRKAKRRSAHTNEDPKSRVDRQQKQQNKTKRPHGKDNPPKTRAARHNRGADSTPAAESPQAEKELKRSRAEEKGFAFKLKYYILSIGIIFVLALVAYTTILYGGKLIVDENKLPVSAPTTIETADGEAIWQLYDEYRQPVDLKEIPKQVQGAFVATEDKRFYSHSGVDFRSILRAVYKDIIARSKVEGASTITQQLAKNLFLTNDKSWLRKTKEVMIALYLEREFSKDEILEMYLNVVYFGQGQYGIGAASNKFFDKSTDEISLDQAALLAGIVNAPNGYSPVDHPDKAKKRRNLVLERMYEAELITKDEKEKAQNKGIELQLTQRKTNDAYQSFVDLVIKEANEMYGISLEELQTHHYQIITSFNKTAQKIAFEQFQEDSYFPGNIQEEVEGAFIMMDENSGEIVSAIGGRHYQLGNLNRSFQMKRQPGSVMKPLAVFAPALESGQYNPYMMLPDEKREWDGKEVHNSDDVYAGEVSFYDAFIQSKNTSAVWLLDEIGIDYAKSYLNKMNMHMDNEKDGLNIALGGLTNGLSPIQAAEGFRTFAHGGEMIDAHAIVEIRDHQGETIHKAEPKHVQVFSEQVAWTMTELLMGVVEKGTGTAGDYPKELVGKTGTTQDQNDLWFVGYTPEYVTALWMGYDKADEDHYLTGGSSYPTKLTKKILSEINRETALAADFTKPENVQAFEQPIELPTITDLTSTLAFGGFKIVKGKLKWPDAGDSRISYHIYEVNEGADDTKIAEVTGESEYVVDESALFGKRSYYVVPYDPLGEREGQPSNTVDVSF